ncbi:hypothetical protein PROFUN_05321 [Planoprotostelium fungivorum]|uniref:Partial AB-hydrolase lipase domain-containing protein n=1 Tax=Planoprotostelium fungivorum TaxID=1890364 RepID=A0A2P6NR08_9EUKA|nr:hypothetical protein PROFUN_05321 [Planoprotostelium fungivorum]
MPHHHHQNGEGFQQQNMDPFGGQQFNQGGFQQGGFQQGGYTDPYAQQQQFNQGGFQQQQGFQQGGFQQGGYNDPYAQNVQGMNDPNVISGGQQGFFQKMESRFFGGGHQAQQQYQQVYQQPPQHQAKFTHEALAGAAAFEAMRKYEQHEAANGRPASHHLAKEIIAGFVGVELDRLIETKGLDYIDRQKAYHMAKQQAHDAYDQNHGYGDNYNGKVSDPQLRDTEFGTPLLRLPMVITACSFIVHSNRICSLRVLVLHVNTTGKNLLRVGFAFPRIQNRIITTKMASNGGKDFIYKTASLHSSSEEMTQPSSDVSYYTSMKLDNNGLTMDHNYSTPISPLWKQHFQRLQTSHTSLTGSNWISPVDQFLDEEVEEDGQNNCTEDSPLMLRDQLHDLEHKVEEQNRIIQILQEKLKRCETDSNKYENTSPTWADNLPPKVRPMNLSQRSNSFHYSPRNSLTDSNNSEASGFMSASPDVHSPISLYHVDQTPRIRKPKMGRREELIASQYKTAYSVDSNIDEKETGSLTMSGYDLEEDVTDSEDEEIHLVQTVRDKILAGKYKDHDFRLDTNHRDWNDEYQRHYHLFISSLLGKSVEEQILESDVLMGLNRVAQEFADTATIYAKIIISEFQLPLERKTIKPIDIGGLAGGTKYRVQNIFYKFAFDSLLSADPPVWMYGNHQADHRAAAKAAKNELRGLEAHSSCLIEGLSYPMMASVGYKGYTVLAMAILPIDKTTLVYGSDDGGKTVHASDPKMNELMQQAGRKMNLSGHVTGSARDPKKIIYGPGDIEGHRGHDGRYYVLDFGRLMPPESSNGRNPRSVFSELLRPELVSAYKDSLCSDAFTRWNSHPMHSERSKINQRVRDATTYLRDVIVPSVAERASSIPFPWEEMWNSSLNRVTQIMDFMGSSAFHHMGINLRNLGLVYNKSNSPNVRKLVMSLAAARCAKTDIREIMRHKMREVQVPSDEPFKSVIVKFLNQLCGQCKHSVVYWRRDLCKQLTEWFRFTFTPQERKDFDLQSVADIRLVLYVTCLLTGIELEPSALEQMLRPDMCGKFRFVESDVRFTAAITKHRSDIYFSAGLIALKHVVVNRDKGNMEKENLLRQVQTSAIQFRNASKADPSSAIYPVAWSAAQLERASILDGEIDEITYRRIFVFLTRALDAHSGFTAAEELYMKALKYYAMYCCHRGLKGKEKKLMEEVERREKEFGSKVGGQWILPKDRDERIKFWRQGKMKKDAQWSCCFHPFIRWLKHAKSLSRRLNFFGKADPLNSSHPSVSKMGATMHCFVFFLLVAAVCAYNATDALTAEGYGWEVHTAHTEDGFELILIRITSGRTPQSRGANSSKPVVFLQHGLIDDCATWVVNQPHESLGFLLADAGFTSYDVFLGNVRGNSYSMGNDKYTENDEEYWTLIDFDRMIDHDLPSMINKCEIKHILHLQLTTRIALEVSGKKSLIYVGHSQGTLMAFGGLTNPTINTKVDLFVALAPVAYVANQKVKIISMLAGLDAVGVLKWFGAHRFLPPGWLLTLLGNTACRYTPFLCTTILGGLVGSDPKNLNVTRLPYILTLEPGGTSVQNMAHWAQLVNSKRFQKFDYRDPDKNFAKYGVPYAPEYSIGDLKRSSGVPPIAFFSGSADLLGDPTDVSYLVKMLPDDNKPILHDVQPHYNHLDFVWGGVSEARTRQGPSRDVQRRSPLTVPVCWSSWKFRFVYHLATNPNFGALARLKHTTMASEVLAPSVSLDDTRNAPVRASSSLRTSVSDLRMEDLVVMLNERDDKLELAAHYGRSLLKENEELKNKLAALQNNPMTPEKDRSNTSQSSTSPEVLQSVGKQQVMTPSARKALFSPTITDSETKRRGYSIGAMFSEENVDDSRKRRRELDASSLQWDDEDDENYETLLESLKRLETEGNLTTLLSEAYAGQVKRWSERLTTAHRQIINLTEDKYDLEGEMQEVRKAVAMAKKENEEEKQRLRELSEAVESQKEALLRSKSQEEESQRTISRLQNLVDELSEQDVNWEIRQLSADNEEKSKKLQAYDALSTRVLRLERENLELQSLLSDKEKIADIARALAAENNSMRSQLLESEELLDHMKRQLEEAIYDAGKQQELYHSMELEDYDAEFLTQQPNRSTSVQTSPSLGRSLSTGVLRTSTSKLVPPVVHIVPATPDTTVTPITSQDALTPLTYVTSDTTITPLSSVDVIPASTARTIAGQKTNEPVYTEKIDATSNSSHSNETKEISTTSSQQITSGSSGSTMLSESLPAELPAGPSTTSLPTGEFKEKPSHSSYPTEQPSLSSIATNSSVVDSVYRDTASVASESESGSHKRMSRRFSIIGIPKLLTQSFTKDSPQRQSMLFTSNVDSDVSGYSTDMSNNTGPQDVPRRFQVQAPSDRGAVMEKKPDNALSSFSPTEVRVTTPARRTMYVNPETREISRRFRGRLNLNLASTSEPSSAASSGSLSRKKGSKSEKKVFDTWGFSRKTKAGEEKKKKEKSINSSDSDFGQTGRSRSKSDVGSPPTPKAGPPQYPTYHEATTPKSAKNRTMSFRMPKTLFKTTKSSPTPNRNNPLFDTKPNAGVMPTSEKSSPTLLLTSRLPQQARGSIEPQTPSSVVSPHINNGMMSESNYVRQPVVTSYVIAQNRPENMYPYVTKSSSPKVTFNAEEEKKQEDINRSIDEFEFRRNSFHQKQIARLSSSPPPSQSIVQTESHNRMILLEQQLKDTESRLSQIRETMESSHRKTVVLDQLLTRLSASEERNEMKEEEIKKLHRELYRNSTQYNLVQQPPTVIYNNPTYNVIQPGQVTKAGWLEKQGAIFHFWKKRYFFLSGVDHHLYYSRDHTQRFLGSIVLSGATVRRETVAGRDHTFVVVAGSKRTFVLAAESEEEMNNWILSIEDRVHFLAKSVVTSLTSASYGSLSTANTS